uniref:Uncharacterized protein n=1 Tax=Rhizophora mucronata TaxID=61149 RepID=A0A2P2PKR0_RHIMU
MVLPLPLLIRQFIQAHIYGQIRKFKIVSRNYSTQKIKLGETK